MFGTTRAYIIFGGCWLMWGALHSWALTSLGMPLYYAITDSAVSNILLILLCTATAFALRYYRPDESRTLKLLLWVAFIAGLWVWLVSAILPVFIPDAVLLAFIADTTIVRYCVGFLITGCFLLINWIWNYVKRHREDEQRRNYTEKLARETELFTLRQQLHPHFLFNTLNSITALIGSRPDEAKRMIHQLSDFLRGTLKKDDRQLITLREELDHLNLYLDIEKVRFGHRLDASVKCDEQCLDMQIPVFLVQPVVENAVKFGLYDTLENVTIHIRAKCEMNMLMLSVSNPFDEQTAVPRQGTGFGLQSVKRRLFLLYGRPDLVHIEKEDNIFTVTLKIPQQV